jgi:hypothetical protein
MAEPFFLQPVDGLGRAIEIGDWVRLVKIPPGLATMPRATQAVFRKALGKTFKVEGFNNVGLAELDLTRKVAKFNTIWVEPDCLQISRKKRQPGAHPSA